MWEVGRWNSFSKKGSIENNYFIELSTEVWKISKVIDDILNNQRSYFDKIGLGYDQKNIRSNSMMLEETKSYATSLKNSFNNE